MTITGQSALITGGKRLGACLASALAARGVDVAVTFNRSRDEAEATAATVRQAGRRGLALQANVARPDDVQRAVDTAASELGRLDILINMASVYTKARLEDLTDDTWARALDVDLSGAFRCARAAVPHLRKAGGGHIVNFSDWLAASGRPRYPGFIAYYVAKRAVMGLTEALALELAPDQIRVNAIAPGPILPPPDLAPAEVAEVEHATPLGRWGGAEAIAAAIVGLLQTDFVTGETIRVDGGRHVR